MDKILTVNDVATVLQVKAITVREMFREKRLRGFKVGKSWRTTEVMLQEDINALARGEAPAELPGTPDAPGSAAPSAKSPLPSPTPVAPVVVTETPKTAPAPRPAKKVPTPPSKDVDEAKEDTQQLLF
jgi:excisionase family DNA binding protein